MEPNKTELEQQGEEIRAQMIILEREMRPLRAELEILSTRFMALWNAKNRIERQLVPIVKLPSRKTPPKKSEEPGVDPDELLKQIQGMNPAQLLEVMQALKEGASL